MKTFSRIGLNLLVLSGVALAGCSGKARPELPNTIRISTPAKIKGLDPVFADDLYSGDQVGQVYDTLLQYHFLKRPYTLEGSLSDGLPTVSADGLTYVFHLKKGVVFQNDPCFGKEGKGRELVADDVLYSFKRLADPKIASSGWWLFDGKIAGLNEWRKASEATGKVDYSTPVEGLKALDQHTVQIQLTSKSFQFLYALAMPFTSIVPREAVEFYGKEFLNHPVGTGAFQLVEYNGSSRIVWDRNPTYRKEFYPSEASAEDKAAGLLEDAGQPLPRADRVIVTVMVEQQPMWLNFLSGKLDIAAIPKDNFASAVTAGQDLTPDLKASGIRLIKTPLMDVTHLSFNMTDPIVGKNKKLRKAMSLAYDEASFIELFYNGRALPAQGPIPPGVAGYQPNFKNPYREFNLKKAKQLLAEAGYPGGKGLEPLDYATLADSTGRQQAEFLQKMMGAIGIQLKVNGYSWPEFQAVVRNRKAQIWEQAWGADYPDAENFLQLFYSKNASPGPNDSSYSNPEYDALYEKALGTAKESERIAIYHKMVALLVEDCPWIFGSHRVGYTLVQPWLKNHKPNELDHSRLKYLRVDSALKK